MNNYNMLVLDLDDTLLQDDLSISEVTKQALYQAQENGVKVAIATGRPTYACTEIAKEIGLNYYGGYIISFNGAVVTNAKTGKILREVSILKEDVHALYELSQKHNAYIQTYTGNYIITPENNMYTEIEKKLTGMEIIETTDFVNAVVSDVIKVIVLQEPQLLKEIAQKFDGCFPADLHMTFSKPFFLEFMNKRVDKSKSIAYLVKKLGLTMSSVIAIGDSYNDISMIRDAGLGVAMGNAIPEAKEIADYIAKDNMNNGVAEVISKFLLSEESKKGLIFNTKTKNLNSKEVIFS